MAKDTAATEDAATDAPDDQPDVVGEALAAVDAELTVEATAPYISARAAKLISIALHAIAGR